jgi:glycosyltransferase involved in cell wall biosynthesis
MSDPLISVIVTNYNYGQYITKAITSVLNQTHKNIELIIINDGSTDNSDEVIRSLIDKNKGRNCIHSK